MTQTIDHKKSGSDGRTGKSSSHETTLADYLTMFLRGKKTILYCLILVTAVDALYTFTRRPGYESSALVLIDMKGTNAALPFSVDITGAATLNSVTALSQNGSTIGSPARNGTSSRVSKLPSTASNVTK